MKKYLFFSLLMVMIQLNLTAQDQYANVASAAFENLQGQNYDLAAQNFELLIKSPYYQKLDKIKSKEKKNRLRALATFQYCNAISLANLGKYDEGLKLLEEAQAKSDNPAFYTFYVGLYNDNYFNNDIDFEKVRATFEIFDDFPIIVQAYLKSLVNRGYFEEALGKYQKILKKDKAPIDYYHVGITSELKGDIKAAKKVYQKGLDAFPIQKNPDNCNYQALHILFLEKLGKADEALKLAKEILENNPKDYCAKNNIALLYYRTGAYEAAVEAYQKLITDNPFYENGFIYLIKSYDQLGQTERALTMLDDLLKVYPNYYDALCARAEILIKNKALEKAKIDVEKARSLMPEHPLAKEINNKISSNN